MREFFLSLHALNPKARIISTLLVVTLATVGGTPVVAMEKKCEYIKEDNNKDVVLEIYDLTSIRLPVQMGTGYSWKVVSLPDVIEQDSVTFKGGGVPGGTELQILRFRGIKKGTGKLVLAQVQPWRQSEPPQETFTLNVTVE
jgi:predicted secreted protein